MGHPAQEACVSTNGWLMSPTSQDLPLSISESQFTGLRRLPPPLRTRCGCRYPEGRLWALSHLFQGPPVFASPPPAALLFEPTAEQWTLQSAQQPAQGGHPPMHLPGRGQHGDRLCACTGVCPACQPKQCHPAARAPPPSQLPAGRQGLPSFKGSESGSCPAGPEWAPSMRLRQS